MITILFLLFYFSRSSTTAIPFIATSNDILARNTSSLLPLPAGTPVCTCSEQRSIWDIIWSCLATIFACTWVSVHPNIPDREEKWWMITLRRVELVIWMLLTPELIILWAKNQWSGARDIAKEQKDKGWGKTHGHFMQMGGFMLYDGDKKMGTLSYPQFKELLAKNRIEFPTTTQGEIEDRSKSDGLSKLLVANQTGWFILQCITRTIEKLPIIELKLATLAFAALNGCMYFFWWNKPFDVRVPVRVNLRGGKADDPNGVKTSAAQSEGSPNPEGNKKSALVHKPWTILKMIGGRLNGMLPRPYSFDRFNYPRCHEAGNGPKRVPTFYSLRTVESYRSSIAGFVLGSMFGAIHCAGWFLHFPTVAELWIWRISSLYIAVYPTLILVILVITLILEKSKVPLSFAFFDVILKVSGVCTILGIVPYIIARFLLLAESFNTLRDLPPDDYAVVQ